MFAAPQCDSPARQRQAQVGTAQPADGAFQIAKPDYSLIKSESVTVLPAQ